MYRQRNHQQSGEREDLDRWLVSYADYMTLMFALFVVLYALSLVKNEEFRVLTDSLTRVFEKPNQNETGVTGPALLTNNTPQSELPQFGASLDQAKGPELVADATRLAQMDQQFLGSPLEALEQELTQSLTQLVEQGLAKVREDKEWLIIELNSGLLFPSGSANTNSSARVVLQEISKIINPINNFLRIRGYTDNMPISNELFSSNWELSVARATSVVRLLESLGTPSFRMAIEGYGQYAPVADNSTAAGRAANRKVEIAISRYGHQPQALQATTLERVADAEGAAPIEAEENGAIQVIALPGGGIRITTRRDNPDALPEQQDP